MTEPQADRFLIASGARMLVERPRDFARASLARLGRFWSVAPSGAVYPARLRLATASWTVPLWAALIVGLLRQRYLDMAARRRAAVRRRPFRAVHAVFWTDLRMRAPIVPAIALIAAGCGRAPGGPREGDGEGPRPSEKNSKNKRKFPRFCFSNSEETVG